MVATGILAEDDRVELLDGDLLQVSPQSEEHAFVIRCLMAALGEAYGGPSVRVRMPLALPERDAGLSIPEPDLAVVPPPAPWCDRPPARPSS
jgi:hypothetical protein